MKSKNLVLACAAVLFAAAGAYASMFTVVNVYVYGRINSATGVKRCIQTNAHCNNTASPKLCQISIPTTSGTQIANSNASGTSFKTFESGCVTPLFDADATSPVVTQSALPVLDEDETLYSLEIPQ